MGANIPGIDPGLGFFGLFYGVHRVLLYLNIPYPAGYCKLIPALGGLSGTAPLGDLPDTVNAGGVIDGLFGYRGYTGPKKPLFSSRGPYFQNPSYFCDGQSFHEIYFGTFF
jgi:hypothetical protein